MCGITGIIFKNASSYIQSMTDAIAHRGPDDEGVFIDSNVALGHRRLSILDLSANGHQPMISEDGKYVIIFNGEIYNHLTIREQLGANYIFKSTSDTETLLYGFAEFGVDIFNKLNGIFALAIYNRETKELVLARDQLGVKPLYYYIYENTFLFSSEIKSLIEFPNFNKELNEAHLANYLYFLWSPGENTPFENCKKLLPGHFLTIKVEEINTLKITKYYEIPLKGIYAKKNEAEWINELDEKLVKAVKRQLLSDVPVGFFLSGGLDSSLIVAIAKKLDPELRLKCYTIDTKSNSSREGFTEDLPYAKEVANILDVDLEIVKADIDILKDFDSMIYHLDEPQADPAPLNVLNICNKAREQGYFVLLGGTAGDDLFSGYRRHEFLYYKQKMKFIPYIIKNNIHECLKNMKVDHFFLRRIKKLFSVYAFSDSIIQNATLFSWLSEKEVKKLFIKDLNLFRPSKFLYDSLQNIANEKSELHQMLFWEMKYFLPDHNLNYTDKMSMFHGVEVRVPYLDLELVEFSTTIPPELKMNGNTTKYLLKKVAERYLPNHIIYRSKSGFGAPVRDWIINDLGEKLQLELCESELKKRAIFNFEAVQKLIKKNTKGTIDASYSIWALLAIQSWLRQFVDNAENESIGS